MCLLLAGTLRSVLCTILVYSVHYNVKMTTYYEKYKQFAVSMPFLHFFLCSILSHASLEIVP